MEGVLVIAHGSRRKGTAQTLEGIVALAKAKLPETLLEICYMELCPPNVYEGLSALKNKGVTKVYAVPYFLFDGIHIKEDIPAELKAFTDDHPEIEVVMGETLGVDPRIADVLAERIKDTMKSS